MKYLYVLLIIGFSLIAAFCYAADKLRAKHNRRRYPEKVLLSLGVLFGAAGALLAMVGCHHKTRKRYFWITNLVSLTVQIALGVYLFVR